MSGTWDSDLPPNGYASALSATARLARDDYNLTTDDVAKCAHLLDLLAASAVGVTQDVYEWFDVRQRAREQLRTLSEAYELVNRLNAAMQDASAPTDA